MKMGSVPVSPKCAKLNTFLLNLIDLLKALDTVGNKRPVFSLGVSQHMHKITTCESFGAIGHQSCERIMEEKYLLSHKLLCFQMPLI